MHTNKSLGTSSRKIAACALFPFPNNSRTRGKIGVSITALIVAMGATDAHAACARSAGSVTCTVPTNNGDGVIGPSAGGTTITTVTVGDGTTEGTFDSNGTAISLGDNTHITINAKATVHSHSGGPALNGHPTGTGPQGIGANTIEVGNNSVIDIYGIVQSDALGLGRTGQGDEVINPTGNGNTINIYQGGKIATLNDSGPTIWFQNLAGANTLANTISNNGTIQAGTSGNGAVIGSGGNVAVNFTNGATGVVNGNLSLGSGANSITLNGGSQFNGSMSMGSGDDLLQFYKGATFTGTINGGGGTNELRLLGNASDPGPSSIIPGSLFNFSRIIKDGTSTWTISGSLSGLGSNASTISVNGGTLLLSGNNDGFLGSTTITAGGTLQIGAGGTAGTLPGAITNNGVLALNRSDALTVAGAITGGGVVQQIGGGTTTLTGAISGGSIVANAGTIALGAAGTLTTNGVQLVPGGTIQAVELTAGGTFSNAGIITVGGLVSDGIHLQGGTFNNDGSVIAPNNVRSGVYAQLGGTITNTSSGLISGGYGIYASTGTNDITVSGNGAVTGTSYIGIHADTTSGNITLGTSAAPLGTVTGGGGRAIDVAVSGSGAIAITAGTVVGASRGISATTTGAGNVAITAGTTTAADGAGIFVSAGAGTVQVRATGTITSSGAGNAGIDLSGNGAGNLVTVATGQRVQGAVGLRLSGSGTTQLANAGTIAAASAGGNAIEVNSGTLAIGTTPGNLVGSVAIGAAGALVVNGTSNFTLANTLTGTGVFTQAGTGLLRLTGTNGTTTGQFTGTANVNAGILAIDGVFGDTAANTATLNVNAGGTLHGSGSFAGSVTVNTGGIVSAGNSPGALTVAGNYTLTGGATSLFELGTPGVVGGSTNDLVTVGGNLTLGGTLSLVDSANATASPVAGSYRLFDYGGALGGAFATITSPSAQTYNVFTDIPGQVNLLVSNGGQALQFWDGTDTTGAGPGGQGGTATWNAGNTNWTGGPASVVNTGWQSGVGIFGGTAGTVTLAGTPDMQGLQFTVDGYRLTGGSLNLTGDPFSTPEQSFVNIDGGAGATIDSALTSSGGSFGLNKIGAGTLTLTGANSYGGATSVTAGTLVLGTGGSLVSTVSVASGATFRNAGTLAAALTNAGTASNTGTVSGPVSNSGSFTTSGILIGGLTNGGTVIVSGGQIDGSVVNQAGSLTITGSATGNATLANAAAADVAVTDTGSYRLAGLFDNAGSLTNAGSFLGDVTNAAGATVTNTGTLATASQAFRNAGLLVSTGTLAGGLANTGTAQLSGTLTGDVANTGSLSVTGPVTGIGALTNDGLVDLGGTTLSVGALAGSSSGAVLRNGRIVIGSADTTTVYAGTIVDGSNTTSLAKVGTGTLILSGNNSYSGGTTLNAGTLHVTGTLASNVSVARGATLSGTGSVGGLVVAAGASVAPGTNGTIGALSVKGDLLFAEGSFYRIDANAAGASDRLLSSGVATLQGGTVMVNADTGVYAPRTRYTILTAAGGVAGQFADVTANFAFLTPNLSYDANNAFLTLSRNDVQFSTVASTPNQRAAGVASQSLGVGGTLYDAIVTLSADQGRRAFDMLSGEVHASAVNARYETAHIVREAILDRLRYGEIGSSEGGAGASAQSVRPRRSAIWGQGFGTFGTTGSDNNAARLRQQHSGLLLGIDTLAGSTWRLGIAGGYTHSSLDIADRNSDASIDGVFGGAYAGTTFGATQLRLGVSYSDANLRTKRIPSFPTLSDTASSRYGGDLGQAFGEAGYRIRSVTGYVEPFIGGAVLHMTRKGFAERGGASALTANSSAYDIATSIVGMQVQDRPRALLGTETPLLLRGLLAYRHAYGDVHPSALVRFAEADQGFTVAGVPIARDAMVAQGGIDWRVSPATTLSLAYTGQVGSQRTQDHGVKVNFLHRW